MFKKIKQFICKLFNIKACQCDDESVGVETAAEEEVIVGAPTEVKVESKVDHCASHTRFRVSCPACVAAVSQ